MFATARLLNQQSHIQEIQSLLREIILLLKLIIYLISQFTISK